MKLNLHENIKKLRKEKGYTQEKLAEALGVTVGAVSKWESGNNTPDILMLTIIADFFDVSVDVLLGYEMSSKKIKDIVDRINGYVKEHRYEEAEKVSADALNRYPHSFAVIYNSAMIYHLKAIGFNAEAAKKAVELFEHSIQYISQNEDPAVNEFTIRNMIAWDYLFVDEKKAFEKLKENNFGGVNDSMIILLYLKNSNTSKALDISTKALIRNLFNTLSSSVYMIVGLSAGGKNTDIEAALDLVDTSFKMMKLYKTKEVSYISRFEAFFYVLKGYLMACKNDYVEMEKYIKKGKMLAAKYDREFTSYDIAKDIKFYFAEDKSLISYDSFGESAVEGIKNINKVFEGVPMIDRKIIEKIEACWDNVVIE